jgi:murein DD-endopeptidase MepM/ murein hydrolase activator NlpD
MTIKSLKKHSIHKLLVLLLVTIPFFAHAGIMSLLSVWGIVPSENEINTNLVAEKNSQTLPVLEAAINFDPTSSVGGGDITIIDESALLAETGIVGSIVEVKERENNDKISVYVVRPGDTLSQIAEIYGVSSNTIRWANDLEGPISPGDRLIILPVSGITHVVKIGGTVENIANIYDGDAREIALFNGISVDKELKPGDEILVPNAVPLDHGKKEESSSSTKTATSTARVSTTVATTSSPSYSGYYTHPVPTAIKTQGIHGYNAIDLGAPVGTPIYAAAAGTVTVSKETGWNGGYGIYIVISHDNGTQTVYAHNSDNIVSYGQRVSRGQLIGYVGSTGNSTGPHVHFEIRGARNPF